MTKEKIKVCDYHGRYNEPCYGKIDEYFDNGKWITFCEGHQGVYNGGWYVPKDPVRRLIFSQQNQRIRELQAENDRLRKENDELKGFVKKISGLLEE